MKLSKRNYKREGYVTTNNTPVLQKKKNETDIFRSNNKDGKVLYVNVPSVKNMRGCYVYKKQEKPAKKQYQSD